MRGRSLREVEHALVERRGLGEPPSGKFGARELATAPVALLRSNAAHMRPTRLCRRGVNAPEHKKPAVSSGFSEAL